MIPPWQKHPEIPAGSIGWRMGYGEDYKDQFDAWFGRKSPNSKRQYANEFPEPAAWAGFYRRRGVETVPVAPLAIAYREFYDLPRMFIVESGGLVFLFDCPFCQDTDDYPASFEVYWLRDMQKDDVEGLADWTGLPSRGVRVGAVPVDAVRFDETKRKSIDPDVLERVF